MAKQNTVNLYARVYKKPQLSENAETGEYQYGLAYLDVIRGYRRIEDTPPNEVNNLIRHDFPLIISREKYILDEMSTWEENDIILLKGVISTKKVNKTSYCPNCIDKDGRGYPNTNPSLLTYITPIFVEKLKHFNDKIEANEDLIRHREISNQILVQGTLLKNPKLYTTKYGINITQYYIAMNRKLRIRADDPSIRTDYPIVKSYGEQAVNDRTYLLFQSEVLIDGILQSRTQQRKATCSCCGQPYIWKDNVVDLVPYAVEYLAGNLYNDEVEENTGISIEDYKKSLVDKGFNDNVEEDLISEDMK